MNETCYISYILHTEGFKRHFWNNETITSADASPAFHQFGMSQLMYCDCCDGIAMWVCAQAEMQFVKKERKKKKSQFKTTLTTTTTPQIERKKEKKQNKQANLKPKTHKNNPPPQKRLFLITVWNLTTSACWPVT